MRLEIWDRLESGNMQSFLLCNPEGWLHGESSPGPNRTTSPGLRPSRACPFPVVGESAGFLAAGFTRESVILLRKMCPAESSPVCHCLSHCCCRGTLHSDYCLNTYLLKNPSVLTRNSNVILYMGSKTSSNNAWTIYQPCIDLVPLHLKRPPHPSKGNLKGMELASQSSYPFFPPGQFGLQEADSVSVDSTHFPCL